jgi:CelD/BcsL family acetyltransferase involved in cellulose biosynthesis
MVVEQRRPLMTGLASTTDAVVSRIAARSGASIRPVGPWVRRKYAPVETAKRPGDEQYEVARLTNIAEMEALRSEWQELYEAGHQNPYNDPGWLLAWVRVYLSEYDEAWFIIVRRRGKLVGVLPCYMAQMGVRMVAFRAIYIMGKSTPPNVTEFATALLHPDDPRGIFRAAVRYLVDNAPAHWHELTLDQNVPWLDPQWFRPVPGRADRPTILPKEPRACVTLPLPGRPEDLVLKRNVKESIRRARNRLTRSGRSWSVRAVTHPDEIGDAFVALRSLHSARAALPGKEAHYNALDGKQAEFVRQAVGDLAARGRAAIYLLELGNELLAARLVLTTPCASYLSVSGMSEVAWAFSPMALLIHEIAMDAIARGATELNLSFGPDEAKMVWSEQVDCHPVFMVVPPRPRAHLAFSAAWPIYSALRYREERAMHRIRGGSRR